MELADAPIGQYRSHDPPKNFALRVKFWKVKSGSIVPAVRHQSSTEVGRDALEMNERTDQKQVEEVIIHWQEKLFNEREVEFYENKINCVSAVDQKYHEDVIRSSDRKNDRVFTYIDADRQVFNEASSLMTTSPDEKSNRLVEQLLQLNHKSVGQRNFAMGTDHRMRLVEEVPAKSTLDRHVITTPSKTMLIMADLSPENRCGTREDEALLCVLKIWQKYVDQWHEFAEKNIDANGQIVIKPDLTKDMPYRIPAAHHAEDVYEFTLTDVSKQMSKVEKEQEAKLLSELYDRHAEAVASQTGMELYPQPRPGELIYYVFGEIVCAKNFEYNDLFVEFFIDLPENWKSFGKPLQGTTQKCSRNWGDVVNFSFPFELQLLHTSSEDGTDPFVSWPTLFLEVSSIDSWSRYRKEGYGYLTLPNSAGCNMFEVPTWRPYGSDVSQQMRRFFTGGAPELQDNTYIKVPTEAEGSRLSKFGFKTVSSGLVTVRMNTILQHGTAGELNKRGRRPFTKSVSKTSDWLKFVEKSDCPAPDKVGGEAVKIQANIGISIPTNRTLEALSKRARRIDGAQRRQKYCVIIRARIPRVHNTAAVSLLGCGLHKAMKDMVDKEDLMCATDSDDIEEDKPEQSSGKIFIGGLHSQTGSDSLEDYFKQYGEIKECLIMRDPFSQRSRGFGFVTFVNPLSVEKVVKKSSHVIDGKKVDPKVAIPRKTQNQFKKVFIGGLASDTSITDVREYFEKHGKVTEVLLMYDKQTRRLRGFGFVSFESEEVAKRICGEGFHKIKGKSVECKRAQPKEVMHALQGRSRAAPYFADLQGFSFPRLYAQYGGPMHLYSQGGEWTPMNPHVYQQLAKMEGFHGFPPGSNGFMNMPERRTDTSPQQGFYRNTFNNVRSPDVRSRSDHNHQTSNGPSSNVSNVQEYDYGGNMQMSQYAHQHSQGNLAPNPSPLNPGGLNPINSPGPVEYISASRTGAGAGHDYAVFSGSVQGFGNGMVSY
eukprot:gene14192-15672_t